MASTTRLLSRNIIWNLLGQVAPLLAALLSVPVLIRALGNDRFGILTLAWMIIGYFSLFDLGLGRALTQLVASRSKDDSTLPEQIRTALLLILLLGIVAAAVFAVLTRWLVDTVLKIPMELQHETLQAFHLMSWCIPVVTAATGFRGVLEAKQKFALVNAVRIPMGILVFAAPAVLTRFSHSVLPAVAALVVIRAAAALVFLFECQLVVPQLWATFAVRRTGVRPLLQFGGWATISNLVSPLMVYLDRFLIGSLSSMSAVSFYVTPYELVTKFWAVPAALVGVLFPAFAETTGQSLPRLNRLFGGGLRYVFLILFPATLAVVLFGRPALAFWIGADYAEHSTAVLQLLAVGVLINSLANVPFALIQGAGRPDLTAKLHLLELPIYLATVLLGLRFYGIVGVAAAWSLRASLDAALLFLVATRVVPGLGQDSRTATWAMVCLGGLLVPGAWKWNLGGRIIYFLGSVIVFSIVGWQFVLGDDDRTLFGNALRGLRRLNAGTPHG
jgi:O-antigen/teichoic acid export membrane protein